jgi:nucleoside-diphosphate-sugar epimerase
MQRYLILGLGHVGKALSQRLRATGARVVGTTTTAAKVDELRAYADEVRVLKGGDREAVLAAAAGADAIVVTVAPNVRQARTREEREASYRDTLVASCESAAAAAPRVLFLSSFSVYGDGGPGSGPITEDTPRRNEEEPSARFYGQAERAVLASAEGCVLRLPDIYGAPGDLSFPERVQLAHKLMQGRGPFSADALLYVIHFQDVVAAAEHALIHSLRGIYNVCYHPTVPPTNSEVFDELCRRQGLAPLQFLGQIKAPTRPISAQKLYDTGYRPTHTDPGYPLR